MTAIQRAIMGQALLEACLSLRYFAIALAVPSSNSAVPAVARSGRAPSHVLAGCPALGGPVGDRHQQAQGACAAPIVLSAVPGVRPLRPALRRASAQAPQPAMNSDGLGSADGNGRRAAEAVWAPPPGGRRSPPLAPQTLTRSWPACSRPIPAEASPSPRVLSLNGNDWRFQLFDRPEAVPAGFGAAGFDASGWPQVGGPRQAACVQPSACVGVAMHCHFASHGCAGCRWGSMQTSLHATGVRTCRLLPHAHLPCSSPQCHAHHPAAIPSAMPAHATR